MARRYIDAMLLCNSIRPGDGEKAIREFDAVRPFYFFREELEIIRNFRAGSESARKELGRRGTMYDALTPFWQPYDREKWELARRTLLEAGEGGPELLAITLLSILLNGQYQGVWIHARYNLVETGDVALETAAGLAAHLADNTPATAIFAQDDLTQVILALVGFGDKGRAHVEKLSRHPNHNVRRTVARAIGEGVDADGASILARLLSEDPEWTVRAAAAEAMGKLGAAREVVGPALAARLKAEKEAFVLRLAIRSLGDIRDADAVPALVEMVEARSLEMAEEAMFALYKITGERKTTREGWRDWHSRFYPAWKDARPR